MRKVIPPLGPDDIEGEDILGVCPWCGVCNMERFHMPNTFGKPEELNRKRCLDCGEEWSGLYRSALKRAAYEKNGGPQQFDGIRNWDDDE